jgi:hypothetical protein
VPWLLVEGQQKMLANFVVVIGVIFVLGTQQNKQLKKKSSKKMLHSLALWVGLPQ